MRRIFFLPVAVIALAGVVSYLAAASEHADGSPPRPRFCAALAPCPGAQHGSHPRGSRARRSPSRSTPEPQRAPKPRRRRSRVFMFPIPGIETSRDAHLPVYEFAGDEAIKIWGRTKC